MPSGLLIGVIFLNIISLHTALLGDLAPLSGNYVVYTSARRDLSPPIPRISFEEDPFASKLCQFFVRLHNWN